MKNRVKIALSAAMLTLLIAFTACSRISRYVSAEGMIWNTLYRVTYNGPENLRDSIVPCLNLVAASVSAFDSLSTVSRINRNETDRMDPVMLLLYKTSLRISRESGGSFDPTVAPLVDAWGFGKGHTASADTSRIDEILQYVGIAKSRAEGDRLVKPDSRMRFNFSAIAKGYGCDAVAEMFRRNGVNDFLIEIGGEIRAAGNSPRGDRWSVAIDKPVVSDSIVHEQQCIIQFHDLAIATSGNYRNFHKEKGRLYGHTIDPSSGRPVKTDVASATVAAPTCMEADAYATAAMAMGSQRAIEMAKRQKLALYLVTDSGRVIMTPQFSKLIKK